MNFIKTLFFIFSKDSVEELRRKESIFSSLFFALLSLILFHYSVDGTSIEISKESAGLLWLIIVFAGTIFTQNIFKKEEENGTFFALLLAPVDRAAVFLGKFAVSFVFLLILELFLLFLSFFLLNLQFFDSFWWLLIIFLGVNAGFSSLGTLISSLLINQKGSSILYPLLLYPLLVPLFMAAVTTTQKAIKSDLSFSEPWLRLIILFDIIFIAVSSLIFESAAEE